MAQIKLSSVSAKNSLAVWLRFNKQCFNCGKHLNFNEFQIEHIHPKSMKHTYQGKSIHEQANLACLCRFCNATKKDNSAIEFYGMRLTELKNAALQNVDSEYLLEQGKLLAESNPSGKFAKLFLSGKYYSK